MRRLVPAALLLTLLAGCGAAPKKESAVAAPNAAAVGFCQDMSVHHEQAILMSQLAITHGTPAIRAIALSILSSQSQDVGAMRGWLRLWNKPAVDPHPMTWMMGSSAMSRMPGMSTPATGSSWMPGMATPMEMVKLYQRTGKAFDILFLQLMIRHHLAGIQMARAAVAGKATQPVADGAEQMVVAEVEDIGLMRAQLAADGGHELAPATFR
ncbi:MAG TPA: DUF305 domain-containing protein [Marmoricola sp.]|nr:DUF305 domain-containing protein [Marmoricola sp.]